jgi:hypothetical protein
MELEDETIGLQNRLSLLKFSLRYIEEPLAVALLQGVIADIEKRLSDVATARAPQQLLTGRTVEIFVKGERIAVHMRSSGKGKHTTAADHMPSSHRRYVDWTIGRIRRDAALVGPATSALCELILERRPHLEQGFRSCLGTRTPHLIAYISKCAHSGSQSPPARAACGRGPDAPGCKGPK